MSRTTRNVVIATPVILLLLAIAIPNFIKPRVFTSMNSCANNIRWIEGAKTEWVQQSHQSSNAVPTEADLLPYLTHEDSRRYTFPHCPSGGTYTLGAVGESPKCSIGGVGHSLSAD
jgi:hypothetical protein